MKMDGQQTVVNTISLNNTFKIYFTNNQYHCHYPNHHLTPTLLLNLLPADSSRRFVQNNFDQRLTEIDREGTFSLPELVTDHQVTGTKIDYRIQHATHT